MPDMKIKIKYFTNQIGEIILLEDGTIQADKVELVDPSQGPAFFSLLAKLITWVRDNKIKSMEIEQEEP